MKISENGLNLIKEFEGCKLTAYKDSVGVWTIGWGTTNYDKDITNITIKQGTIISQSTADNWLKKSVNKKYVPLVEKYNNKYNFNQNQFDALVSFAYNIGSIDQLTNNGNRSISEIANSITAYNKAGGVVLSGLTRRRQAEKKLFLTPIQAYQNEIIDIFDTDLYNSSYLDLQKAFGGNEQQLKSHFLTCGLKEGRIGSYVFDGAFYLNKYPDLKSTFGNDYSRAYEHFIKNGIYEGRQASAGFDVVFYKNANSDLINMSNIDALKHFLNHGINEGRASSSEFYALSYRNKYQDLQKIFGNNNKEYFKHYIQFGKNEGRNCKI